MRISSRGEESKTLQASSQALACVLLTARIRSLIRDLVGRLVLVFHRRLQTTDTSSDSFAEFRKLLVAAHLALPLIHWLRSACRKR